MSLLYYCFASTFFVLFISFGLAFKNDEQWWVTVAFFLFGAMVGWLFGNYAVGFIAAVILSLIFW